MPKVPSPPHPQETAAERATALAFAEALLGKLPRRTTSRRERRMADSLREWIAGWKAGKTVLLSN